MLTFLLVATALVLMILVLLARTIDANLWRKSLVAYRLTLPSSLSADDVAAWLAQLSAATHAPRFSLIGAPALGLEVRSNRRDGITHTLLVPRNMRGAVLASLRAALPGVRVEGRPDYLSERPTYRVAAEARLVGKDRPLAHDRAEHASRALLAALSPMHGEACIQWLFVGAHTPAPVRPKVRDADTLLDLLNGNQALDGDALRAARKKIETPLHQAVLRIGVSADDRSHAYSVFGRIWGAARSLSAPGAVIVRRILPSFLVAGWLRDLSLPLTTWPLLLNSKELAGLLTFPLGAVHLPGLTQRTSRQLPPAEAMPRRGTVIGMSTYPGMTERPLAIKTSDRLRGIWALGPPGVGKSTLLGNMALQDIQAGRGIVVIDPKTDLVTDLLNRIPPERQYDVLVIDPSAVDYPVGINLLDIGQGEHARELAVDHITYVMASLWRSSFGPRSMDITRNALLTLTHTRAADGSKFTMIELPELLQNPRFRTFVTSQPTVPDSVRSFWLHFEQMSEGERASVISPSLNKLRQLTTRAALRLLLGQSIGVRLDEVFTRRRIILMPLSSGILGSGATALTGSLILAGLWQATQARFAIPPERRNPVTIYADEFQEVLRLPIDLADMLAKSRGAGVAWVLAHQYLGQLSDDMKTAVLGAVRSQILFQTEYSDAHALAPRFAPLSPADLTGLNAYEIAARLCTDNTTLGPVSGRTLPLPDPITDGAALALASRRRFGKPRAEVEAALIERISPPNRPGVGLGRELEAGS
jgi:hypothetical protein